MDGACGARRCGRIRCLSARASWRLRESRVWISRLRSQVRESGSMLIGFDFPIDLTVAYAYWATGSNPRILTPWLEFKRSIVTAACIIGGLSLLLPGFGD